MKTIKFTIDTYLLPQVKSTIARLEKGNKMNELSYTISDVYKTWSDDKVFGTWCRVEHENVDVCINYDSDYSYVGCNRDGRIFLCEDNIHIENTEMRCSACGRKLKHAIYVRNDKTGEILTLGGSCVEQYIGGKFYTISEINTIVKEPHEPHGKAYYKISRILALSLMAVKKYGFAPSSAQNATVKFVKGVLDNSTIDISVINDMVREFKWGDEQEFLPKANELLALWRKQSEPAITSDNTYMYNVWSAMQKDFISIKDLGLVCSACKNAFAVAADNSNWVGSLGDKLRANIKSVSTLSYPSDYSKNETYYITTFITENGDSLVYKGNLAFGNDVKKISFTVKSHDMFKNKKTTRIVYVRDITNKA